MAFNYDDFRADIGDANSAFSDADIDQLETRAIARWGADAAYEGARVMAIQQLMVNAAKFSDYTANESSQKKQQIFKNFESVLKMYKADLDDVLEIAAGANVRMGHTTKKPPRRKEYPDA
jgi:hypothetical protein